MKSIRKRGWSLSTQATALVAAAGVLAALVGGGLLLGSTYTLAREQNDSALSAYRQLLCDNVNGRLETIDRIGMGFAARDVMKRADPEALTAPLRRTGDVNAEYLDAVLVASTSGRVIAGSQGAPSRLPAAARGALGASGSAFVWERASNPHATGQLWAVCRDDDAPHVVLLRVRTGFIEDMLADVCGSGPDRHAALLDEDHRPLRVGKAPLEAVRVSLGERDARGSGTAEATLAGTRLRGFYSGVDPASGLDWHVVVLDSEDVPVERARAAVLPGIAMIAAIVAIALAGVYAWSRSVIAPLRLFERRAREAAAGAYARPLEVGSDDEVGRLSEAFNRMGSRLNSLQDVSGLLAGGQNLGEVLDAVLSATGHILGTGDAAVLLVDEDRTEAVLARGHGLREASPEFAIPLEADSPVCVAIVEQTPVEFRAPTEEWGRALYALFAADEDRQGVAVPLIVGHEVLGALVVLARGSRPLAPDQTETLRAFCSQAAVAVHSSRLFQHESAARAEAEVLRRVAEVVASSGDIERTLHTACEMACDILEMDGYVLALSDREAIGLGASPQPERDECLFETWAELKEAEQGDLAPVVVEGHPRLCRLSDVDTPLVLLVPLQREGALGAIAAFFREGGHRPLGRRHLEFSDTIGKELSLGLENASLLAKARGRAANLETVFRISQAVSSSLQLSVVLNRVLDVVQKIFGADAVSLMSYDSSKRLVTTSMARGVSSREMLALQVAPGEDVPGKVHREGAAMSLRDLELVDTNLARLAVSQGLRSMLAVPLLARGRSVGVLSVFARQRAAFSGEDMELLLTFAAQAALAIDTAGLYGREHHVSKVLQSSILPDSLPEIEGVEAEAFYLPVSEDAEIGGDFYDLIAMPDGRVVVSIGDVCGKGVTAATKTSMIKHSQRGMVVAGMGPADILTELNRLVAVAGDPADIVTMWLGFIDPVRGTLIYANGGHPPALLRRKGGGEIERLEATGPLLGALEDIVFEQRELEFSRGDVLMTYTDGVTEAREGDVFFGEAGVRRVLDDSSTAHEAVDKLLSAVKRFSGGTLRDDAAGLAVRLLGEDAQEDSLPVRRGRVIVKATQNERSGSRGKSRGSAQPKTSKKGRTP